MPPAKPRDLAEYLARIPGDKRAALEKLRSRILAAAPGAEDCIAWQMPSFRHEGRLLVCYAAARSHCSLYPMSAQVIEDLAEDLEGYSTSRGTIRFDPAKPLPAALVKKVVKARIAENREKGKPRGAS
jgi:uncharacterized protein YdhG (YjbR/CyaY superfamily)